VKFGSLFSGFGGIDLGLERAGMECAWQVEIEPYCLRVLEKHWPNVTRYGDIREVDFERVEPVELLAGGFPCQDLSYAGKGVGLSGERSGLWREFKRAICVVRPRYVLVENVPGLLGRGMGVVLGDLASLGYDAEWQSLPAAAFGAPHLRWRVFIIAYPRGDRCSGAAVSDGERQALSSAGGSGEGDVADSRRARIQHRGAARDFPGTAGATEGQEDQRQRGGDAAGHSRADVADTRLTGLAGWSCFTEDAVKELATAKRGHTGDGGGQWGAEPNVGRVDHGAPSRVDRLRGLGNAVVPQVAEYVGCCILEADRSAA
jgi:DNA (cytosine-5)-methyltransferase 1